MSAGPYSQWEIDVMKRAADATSEERSMARRFIRRREREGRVGWAPWALEALCRVVSPNVTIGVGGTDPNRSAPDGEPPLTADNDEDGEVDSGGRRAPRKPRRSVLARVLGERNEAIELVTLKEALAQAGDLDQVGGPAYISSLVDGVTRCVSD
jgi:hypothetical protein